MSFRSIKMNRSLLSSPTNNNMELIRNTCQALKKISSQHEQLNANFRKERHEISKNCVNLTKTTVPFDSNPFEVITKKVDDLRLLTSCNQVDEIDRINQAASSLDTSSFLYHSNLLKSMLSNCENKCHEVLTQLANVDFILSECEDSLETYHMKMVDSMIEYNFELNNLYKRRLSILTGYPEPSLIQEGLDGPPVRMPEFWFRSMALILNDYDIFQPKDRDALCYLSDVRYYYNIESMLIESMNITQSRSSSAQSTPSTLSRSSSPLSSQSSSSNILNMTNCQVPASINSNHRSQVLLFIFKDNPYFSDKTLTKKLYIDKSRLKAGQEMCDGLWVTRKEGCRINWYEGRDITRDESNYDHPMANTKIEPNKSCSFFEFFTDDGFDNDRQIGRRDGKDIELDYQVFLLFRDIIVPHAVVAYCREDN